MNDKRPRHPRPRKPPFRLLFADRRQSLIHRPSPSSPSIALRYRAQPSRREAIQLGVLHGDAAKEHLDRSAALLALGSRFAQAGSAFERGRERLGEGDERAGRAGMRDPRGEVVRAGDIRVRDQRPRRSSAPARRGRVRTGADQLVAAGCARAFAGELACCGGWLRAQSLEFSFKVRCRRWMSALAFPARDLAEKGELGAPIRAWSAVTFSRSPPSDGLRAVMAP